MRISLQELLDSEEKGALRLVVWPDGRRMNNLSSNMRKALELFKQRDIQVNPAGLPLRMVYEEGPSMKFSLSPKKGGMIRGGERRLTSGRWILIVNPDSR